MHLFTQQAVILFTLLTLPPAVLAGSTTYNILNYPDLQNGWTVSGTITTDGFIGDLNENDIKSWTWTISSGWGTYTATSTDPGSSTGSQGPGFQATTTEILLHLSTTPATPITTLSLLKELTPGLPLSDQLIVGMQWENFNGYMETQGGLAGWPTNIAMWETKIPSPPAPTAAWLLAQTSDAAVPEPAPLYLVGFGAVCGCAYVMGHKRRARRTATTAA